MLTTYKYVNVSHTPNETMKSQYPQAVPKKVRDKRSIKHSHMRELLSNLEIIAALTLSHFNYNLGFQPVRPIRYILKTQLQAPT